MVVTQTVLTRPAGSRRRLGAALVGLVALTPALLVAVGLALSVGWPAGLIGLVVLWAVGASGLWRAAPGRALRFLEARPVGQDDRPSARLHNLVESLCAAGGLPKPALLVVDDPAPNALAVGLSPARSSLVVTSGLLSDLSRVELEGVIAHQLCHIRRGDAVLAAVSAVSVGPLCAVAPRLGKRAVQWLLGGREAAVDLAAIGLTRFPPGLTSALEKMRDHPMASRSDRVAWLWDAPPVDRRARAGTEQAPRPTDPLDALDQRIGALREL